MAYQCVKCRKVYSKEDLIEERSYKITKEGLIPICPNCKSKKFIEYDLIKIK